MIWYHVHKCAGTLMCHVANTAGERVVQPNKNCNWHPYDAVHGLGNNGAAEPTCAARAQFFSNGGFTWGAIEHERRNMHPCPQFMYGTMLRAPLDLMDSIANVHEHDAVSSTAATIGGTHVTHTHDLLGPLYNTLVLSQGGQAQAERVRPIIDRIWNLPSWTYFDNFQTRTFANAMNLPPGGVTEAHFAQAVQFLEKLDVVVVLDELTARAPNLVQAVGWASYVQQQFAHKVNSHPHPPFFTQDENDFLRQQNQYDIRLVSHFSKKR
jgi:hypothetical protein